MIISLLTVSSVSALTMTPYADILVQGEPSIINIDIDLVDGDILPDNANFTIMVDGNSKTFQLQQLSKDTPLNGSGYDLYLQYGNLQTGNLLGHGYGYGNNGTWGDINTTIETLGPVTGYYEDKYNQPMNLRMVLVQTPGAAATNVDVNISLYANATNFFYGAKTIPVLPSGQINNSYLDIKMINGGTNVSLNNSLMFLLFNLSTTDPTKLALVNSCTAELTFTTTDIGAIYNNRTPIPNNTDVIYTYNASMVAIEGLNMIVNNTPKVRLIPFQIPWGVVSGNCFVCDASQYDVCDGNDLEDEMVCWQAWSSDTIYNWNLVCNDSDGNTKLNESGNYTYKMPKIVSDISVAKSYETATLSWTVDEATYNHVYINGDIFNQSNTVKYIDAVVDVTGLIEGQTYDYNVTSCDQKGQDNFLVNERIDWTHCSFKTGSFTTSTRSSGSTTSNNNVNVEEDEVCVEDWSCDEWSECDGQFESRECVDANECGLKREKPPTLKLCSLPEENQSEEIVNVDNNANNLGADIEDPEGDTLSSNQITGQVTGDGSGSSSTAIWVWSIVGLAIAGVVGVNIYNRRRL